MSEEQFIDVMYKIADFMDADANNMQEFQIADIHVIGGEPSMLGVEFFKNTLPQIKERFARVKPQVKLGIVTNLLQPRSVEIARMFDTVSTSYEFKSRFTKPKQEERWMANCKTLLDEGRNPNITMAVTKYATDMGARPILKFLHDIGFSKLHFGFFIPSGDGMIHMADVFPTFEATTQFMKDATDWYLERRLEQVDLYVNPVESMIQSIYFNETMDDIVCPIIPGSLDIDWNGETVTCIEAGGEVDTPSLGNIFATDVQSILNNRAYKIEKRKAMTPKPHCIGCDELDVCQSACGILHQYWNGKGECPGFKGFIKYIRELVDSGTLPKSELLNKDKIKGARC